MSIALGGKVLDGAVPPSGVRQIAGEWTLTLADGLRWPLAANTTRAGLMRAGTPAYPCEINVARRFAVTYQGLSCTPPPSQRLS